MDDGTDINVPVIVRLIVLYSLLVFTTSCAYEQRVLTPAPHVDRIDITDTGIYQYEVVGRVTEPNLPEGSWQAVNNSRNVVSTTTIPVRLNANFGFHYIVIGEPKYTYVTLRIISRGPEKAKTNEYSITRPLGVLSFTGRELSHPRDLVPGVETFEIWYEGRKLAEQSFTLVKLP